MKSLVAIRTYRWGEEEQRLFDSLSAADLGDDIAVVMQNRPDGLTPPLTTIDVTDEWVADHKLHATEDWGWRCGDYSFYAMRHAKPEYDHYWLIEPDVLFTDSPKGFFGECEALEQDLLGYRPKPYTARNPFVRGLRGIELYRAIFALTRISGRALDRLYAKRVDYSAIRRPERTFTNDELFVYSHVMADPDLSVGDFEELTPNWFQDVHFDTNPDLMDEAVPQNLESGRVFHPVRSRIAYREALANRLTTWPGFLSRSRASIVHLTDDDIDDIAARAAQRLKSMLTAARG